MGPVTRLAGGLLDFKPILTIKKGVVQSVAQHRTRARAIDELKQLAIRRCQGLTGLRMGVMHAVCREDAQRIAETFERELHPEKLAIAEISPAVGTHTGPGTLAACWYAPRG